MTKEKHEYEYWSACCNREIRDGICWWCGEWADVKYDIASSRRAGKTKLMAEFAFNNFAKVMRFMGCRLLRRPKVRLLRQIRAVRKKYWTPKEKERQAKALALDISKHRWQSNN